MYIHKSLKFNLRDYIDIFNESVETLSIEILNKKSRNIVITAAYRPPKRNNKLSKDFCKDFLNKQEMSNKAAFLWGHFNLNALDYDTNNVVKNFFNLVFQNGFQNPLSKDLRELLEQAAIDHILTNRVLENKILSGISKTDISDHFPIFTVFNPLSANPIKWSNILKQFPGNLPTNCLSVFDHFLRLALKGLRQMKHVLLKKQNLSNAIFPVKILILLNSY